MNITLQRGVNYPCHFLGKNPDDTGYIMFLFDMDCNLRIISLLLGFTQKGGAGGRHTKRSFVYFIYRRILLQVSPRCLPCIIFFGVSLKIMAVIKQLSFTNNGLCARPCAGSRVYILSCNPLSKCQRWAPMLSC